MVIGDLKKWLVTHLNSHSHSFVCDNFIEIMQMFYQFFHEELVLQASFPFRAINRPKHLIGVANDFRTDCGESGCHLIFQLVLVGNDQVTVVAIAAEFIQ